MAPPWHQSRLPELKEQIPGIGDKELQPAAHRKAIATEYLEEIYPSSSWTRVYTDGSAENATQNGGAGVYIQLKDGTEDKAHCPTGKFCNNYKAETEAIRMACTKLLEHQDNVQDNVVILTDCKSVIQALSSGKSEYLKGLEAAISDLLSSPRRVAIQWIPSHCGLWGNETADQLAKAGSDTRQDDLGVGYGDSKSLIRRSYLDKWKKDHPHHKEHDAWHSLNRQDQVTIFRLRTGHTRLRSHMFHKFKVGDTPLCPCNTAPMTVAHILEDCPLFLANRAISWPTPTSLDLKLWGDLGELQKTANYIIKINVAV